ncbi:hypothetical protein BKA81DRAFT_374421 [Phyllosticta paracitricarpa]
MMPLARVSVVVLVLVLVLVQVQVQVQADTHVRQDPDTRLLPYPRQYKKQPRDALMFSHLARTRDQGHTGRRREDPTACFGPRQAGSDWSVL